MDILLYGIILAVATSLLANIIFRWIPLDRPAIIIVAAVLIIICTLLSIYRKENQQRPEPPPTQERTYEITEYANIPWQQLLSKANSEVRATGALLTTFGRPERQILAQKLTNNERFKVQLFMLKPDSRIALERAKDERMDDPGKLQVYLAERLVAFHEMVTKELSDHARTRITIKCVDVYPTIAVIIIDDDLYTYSYPHGSLGASGPVIIFRNYKRNIETSNVASFFEKHLDSIAGIAKEPTEADYMNYKKLASSIPR